MLRRLIYYFVSIYAVSRSEARGFTILIPVLFIVIITPLWFKYLFDEDSVLDKRYHQEFKEWIAASKEAMQKAADKSEKIKHKERPNYHEFDPNMASAEELIVLGFKPWIAERIIKYRKAGGRLESAEDLKKIYGISEEHLVALAPYVKIKLSETTVQLKEPAIAEYKNVVDRARLEISIKNINSAVAEDLIFVRGIGPVLSERIIKYRDMLGGFYSLGQFDEVYGLESAIADSLKQYVYLDTVSIRRLAVNYLKAEELRKHPYIDYRLANALEQYRIQHGDYTKPADLLAIKILDDSTFQKILPYLKID